jgi:hypothetical protein
MVQAFESHVIRTPENFESIFSNEFVAGPTGPAISFGLSAEFFWSFCPFRPES